MSCVRLLLKVLPNVTPSYLLDADGFLSVDTDSDFDLKSVKRIEELTEINKIKTSGIVSFSVPSTFKNDFIFKRYVDINSMNFSTKPIDIYVIVGSTYLVQSALYVIDYNRGVYELEIRNGYEHWITQAKDYKLSDTNFGSPSIFNQDYVDDANALNQYVDNGVGVRFPLVHYGSFANQLQLIRTEDFRPWFSMLYVLQKAFCSIGWTFRSPIFESDYGRSFITYLSSKTINNDDSLRLTRDFNVKVQDLIQWDTDNNGEPIKFLTILKDLGLNYDTITGYYKGLGVHDITAKIRFKFKPESSSAFNHNPEECSIISRLMYYSPDLGIYEIASERTEVNKQNGYRDDVEASITHEFDVKDVQLDADCGLFMSITVEKNNVNYLNILPDSVFSGICRKLIIQSGDLIDLKNLIDNSHTLLNFLKGAIHLVNGKLATNFITKTITLYSPYDVNIEGESIEGFFIDNLIIDLTDKIQKDSDKIKTLNDVAKKRYRVYKFNGKGDKAIEALKLKEDDNIFSYKVDFGASYETDTDYNENPFFEATINKIFEIANSETYNAVDLPYILDNDNYKLSFDIKPRVLLWAGNVQQFNQFGSVLVTPSINVEGTIRNTIPYAYQLSNCKALDTFNVTPKYRLIYGIDDLEKDLFNFFYKRWVFENDFTAKTEYLAFLTRSDFSLYDLRSKFMIMTLGRTAIGRISEMRDFSNCTFQSTPIVFVNERQLLSPCYDLNVNDFENLYCLQNQPTLTVTQADNDYYFGIGGTNVSTIDEVIYEVRILTSNNWNEMSQILGATESFEVRMKVSYTDFCPVIVKSSIVLITPTCVDTPLIQASYDSGIPEFTMSVINSSLPILETILYYSPNDDVNWILYSGPQNVSFASGDIIYLKAIITYVNGCPQIQLDDTLEII